MEKITNKIKNTEIVENPFSQAEFLKKASNITKEEFFKHFMPENPTPEEVAVVEWMAKDIPFKKLE
jgi:hypothetical protein